MLAETSSFDVYVFFTPPDQFYSYGSIKQAITPYFHIGSGMNIVTIRHC